MNSNASTDTRIEHARKLWCIRKWTQRVRQRIMDKRVVGAVDLYTMDPIPPESLVSVYDPKHKTKYLFHTNTISRILLFGITYSAYGIASPKMPTNPYTNIPWTIGQIIVIVGQIVHNLNRNHCTVPHYIYLFRKAMYNIPLFLYENKMLLNVDAAYAFFKKEDDAYRDVIYSEIVEDLYVEHRDMLVSGWRIARSIVLAHRLPIHLKIRWDKLVISSWILQNHRIPILEEDIGLVFLSVHIDTISWWRAQTLFSPLLGPTMTSIVQTTARTPPAISVPPPVLPPVLPTVPLTVPLTVTPPVPPPILPPVPPPILPTVAARVSPSAPSRYISSNAALPILANPRHANTSATGRPPRPQQLMPPAPPPSSTSSSPISLLTDDEDILDLTIAQMRTRPR